MPFEVEVGDLVRVEALVELDEGSMDALGDEVD